NDWLDFGALPIIVFSAVFVVGYIVIWAIIYSIIKSNAAKLNKMLKQKQQSAKDSVCRKHSKSRNNTSWIIAPIINLSA
ncbi:MAG: DUF3021 family protein, partial [Bacteroidales bacterium]|nr:DUF3021 family protein [Bacteroidales bacterium]